MVDEFLALMRYRDLVVLFISRSLKTRYKRSALGVVWTMLNPLLTMIVLSLVFSQLFRANTPYYPVYILSGLTAWLFFSAATNQAMGDIIFNGGLLNRIYVPKAVFAVSAVGAGLVNLGIALVILLAIALISGVGFSWSLLVLPFSILLLVGFALGVGLMLETGAVFFADIVPVYEVFLMVWMYATPIIYPMDIIPVQWQWLFRLNPMYYLVNLFRQPIYDGVVPSWDVWAISLGITVLALGFGWYLFTSRSHEYAYRV
jgi:ABC-type polysaccharide/polyol phosphate export permease